jgi:hypothetical protein
LLLDLLDFKLKEVQRLMLSLLRIQSITHEQILPQIQPPQEKILLMIMEPLVAVSETEKVLKQIFSQEKLTQEMWTLEVMMNQQAVLLFVHHHVQSFRNLLTMSL